MGVKNLIAIMGKANIAKDLDEHELREIGENVLKRAEQDLASMKEWIDGVDEGLKLCKPEFIGQSEPWEGSANFKSTLLTEASNNFGNRASLEIMRDMELVKAQIVGIQTLKNVIDKKSDEIAEMKESLDAIAAQMQSAPDQVTPEIQQQVQEVQQEIAKREATIKEKKDAIKQKTQRADRVTEYMNWQVNNQMTEWRRDMKRLFYSIPNIGSTFKKTYYDRSKGRCVSDVINYPNFIVNQATVDMASCRSFTHILAIDENSYNMRVANDVWVKLPEFETKTESEGDKGSNEANGVEFAADNEDCFYEQYCWLDLDEDGMDEPYIVTVQKSSSAVVRIVARFDFDGLIVKFKDMKPMPLLEAQKARAAEIIKEAESLGTKPEIPDATDLTGFDVIRIEPNGVITKYGFIPSYDGTFLDIGFFHLIGALTMGVNKTTNDLLNSGTLANNQMGMSAKGFRKRQGDFKFKMGQIMATEIPADQLQNSIYMLNFKEPSPTLFQLAESMKNSAGSFAANVDAGGQIMANTAPTTALAMVQESLMQHSAHIGLIIDSMGDEFKILFDLNSEYASNDDYIKVVGDDEAVYQDDFSEDGLAVVCGANPEMSSRTQRMMLADAELAQVPLVQQAGGNPIPIIKNYFKAIGSTNVADYFPNEAEMSPNDRAQMKQMQQLQDQANQLKQQELELKGKEVHISELQVALLKRSEDRKDAEFELSKHKTLADIDKILEEVQKITAETKLTEEQAQAVSVTKEIGIAKTAKELGSSDPIDNSHESAVILKQMELDSAERIKRLEIESISPEKEDESEESNVIAELIQTNTQAIQSLVEKIAQPKTSQITISKQADGSFSAVKVEE